MSSSEKLEEAGTGDSSSSVDVELSSSVCVIVQRTSLLLQAADSTTENFWLDGVVDEVVSVRSTEEKSGWRLTVEEEVEGDRWR